MNYLQIWIGDKPSELIMYCIKSVLNNVTENDTYTLIANTNILKGNKKVNFISLDNYLKQYPEIDIRYKEISHAFQSDLIRFHYAYNNENTLYADCDVELEEISKDNDFTKDLFAKLNIVHYDIFLFYSPGKSELLKKLLELNKKAFSENMKPSGGFYVPYLAQYMDDSNEIKGKYLHIRYSRKVKF
jgi:hypothetical protein